MRCWAKARASAPRTGKLCPGEAGASPIFPGGKAPEGSWSRTPGWWGCPRAPWNTNRHLRTQETAPYPVAELLKRLQGPRLDPEQLGGARAAAPHGGGCEARSSSEGALAQEEDPCRECCGALGPAQRGSGSSPLRRDPLPLLEPPPSCSWPCSPLHAELPPEPLRAAPGPAVGPAVF